MSNLLLKKFASILIFLVGVTAILPADNTEDSLRIFAEREVMYGNYLLAIQLYTSIIESGQTDEEVFYRLAYLHEQLEEFPASLFYLRQLHWKTGDPLIQDKLSSLLESPDRSIPEGDPASLVTILSLRYRWWIMATILSLLLIAAGLIFSKWDHRGKVAIWVSSFSLLLALFVSGSWQFSSPRAVIVLPTYFYQSPGYGAERISLPLSAGSTVILHKEQDIWMEIEANGSRAWVPAFVLSPLEEWQ